MLSTMSSPSVVIAAGGTGGHIYPGLALADALRRMEPQANIEFVGTRRGLEGSIVPEAGYRLHFIEMVPFFGVERVLFPWRLLRATFEARSVLRQTRASVAVSMGGYVGAPVALAARLARVPSLMHESGAVAGRANRLTARVTPNVALAYEASGRGLPTGAHTRVVGMPLARWAADFDRESLRIKARRHFHLGEDAFVVLILGGSQGAARLNSAAAALATRWSGRGDMAMVVKTGRDHVAEVEGAIRGAAMDVRVVAFLERIELAFAACDLAITRAGAGTVAELAATGTPSILVPFPHAPHDHQTVNASILVEAGAAVMVRDDDATAAHLGPLVEEYARDRAGLERMAKAAREEARPRAAEELAEWVLELGGAR